MCYCQSSIPFEECCQPIHLQPNRAQSPHQLMRARYSAFCTRNVDFLNRTSSSKRPLKRSDLTTHWLSLEVLDHGHNKETGWVEFRAYFKDESSFKPTVGQLHEYSLFEYRSQRGHWVYTSGQPHWSTLQVRRNDPCVCKSGAKWKKCCGS